MFCFLNPYSVHGWASEIYLPLRFKVFLVQGAGFWWPERYWSKLAVSSFQYISLAWWDFCLFYFFIIFFFIFILLFCSLFFSFLFFFPFFFCYFFHIPFIISISLNFCLPLYLESIIKISLSSRPGNDFLFKWFGPNLSPAFPNFKPTLGYLECRSSSKSNNFRGFLLSLLRRRPMLRTIDSSWHSPRVTWPRWSWPGTSWLGKREPWLSASRKYPWSQNPKGFESSQHVLKYLRWSRLRKHSTSWSMLVEERFDYLVIHGIWKEKSPWANYIRKCLLCSTATRSGLFIET